MKFALAKRRALGGAAALTALTLSLAACSTGSASDPNAVPDVKGNPHVTLNVFAAQFPDYNLSTSWFTKEMSKKFNISFKFQTTTLDGGAAKEKRSVALASGDYPDAFMLIPWVDQFTPAEVQKYGKQGVLVPLQGLIKKYAPNIQKALDTNPTYKKYVTPPDGNIYGLPQFNDCFHCSYQDKLWMNQKWLDTLGLQQPKTTDDLKKVLEAFKTRDPNGNGKADEIPISGNTADALIPYLMNAFAYDPQGENRNSTLVLKDGKVAIQSTSDQWKQGLAFIKSLWDEGLIDKAAFTQNRDASIAEGDNAKAVIIGSGTALHPGNLMTLFAKDHRDAQYRPVAPLTGPAGTAYAAYTPSYLPGATFALTNKSSAEQRVQAIKMIDYLFTTEGGIEGTFGKEGVDWSKPAAGDLALDTSLKPLYKVIPVKAGAKPTNNFWSATAQYYAPASFRNAQVQPKDIYDPTGAGYERRLFDATKLYEGHEDKSQVLPVWTLWIDPASSSEAATLQTNIENYQQQSALEFITGKKSLDTDWDSYVKGMNGLGLPRYLQIWQKAYDQAYKK